MEKMKELKYKAEKIYKEYDIKYKIEVNIILTSEGGWSVTGGILEQTKNGRWTDHSYGRLDKDIIRHFPSLKDFVMFSLFYSWNGLNYMALISNPMHAFKEDGLSAGRDMLQIDDETAEKLYEASLIDDKPYYIWLLFEEGIIDRQKSMSDALIKRLEDLCKAKWERPIFEKWDTFSIEELEEEEKGIIEERIKAGYYSHSNIQKIIKERKDRERDERRKETWQRYKEGLKRLKARMLIDMCLIDFDIPISVAIYYDHSNELVFNWTYSSEKITREEFDDFVKNVDRKKLPKGIKMIFKEEKTYRKDSLL